MRAITRCHPERGNLRKPSLRKGFSLIELLIVLALILVMAFMSRDTWRRERSKKHQVACTRNLASQYVALQTYATDYGGWFPRLTNATSPAQPLSLLVPAYTTQTEFWICPAAGDGALKPAVSFADRRISYAYYMGRQRAESPSAMLVTDAQVDATAKLEKQLLFSADGKGAGNNHGADGGNFLRTDGSQGHSPSHASVAFPLATNVTLLNPTR